MKPPSSLAATSSDAVDNSSLSIVVDDPDAEVPNNLSHDQEVGEHMSDIGTGNLLQRAEILASDVAHGIDATSEEILEIGVDILVSLLNICNLLENSPSDNPFLDAETEDMLLIISPGNSSEIAEILSTDIANGVDATSEETINFYYDDYMYPPSSCNASQYFPSDNQVQHVYPLAVEEAEQSMLQIVPVNSVESTENIVTDGEHGTDATSGERDGFDFAHFINLEQIYYVYFVRVFVQNDPNSNLRPAEETSYPLEPSLETIDSNRDAIQLAASSHQYIPAGEYFSLARDEVPDAAQANQPAEIEIKEESNSTTPTTQPSLSQNNDVASNTYPSIPSTEKIKRPILVYYTETETKIWDFVEKGSRQGCDMLIDPEGNHYSKNGNRWGCSGSYIVNESTKSGNSPSKKKKQIHCPATVLEDKKDGKFKVIVKRDLYAGLVHKHNP